MKREFKAKNQTSMPWLGAWCGAWQIMAASTDEGRSDEIVRCQQSRLCMLPPCLPCELQAVRYGSTTYQGAVTVYIYLKKATTGLW